MLWKGFQRPKRLDFERENDSGLGQLVGNGRQLIGGLRDVMEATLNMQGKSLSDAEGLAPDEEGML